MEKNRYDVRKFHDGDKIVGCGAIGPYWDKVDEELLCRLEKYR